MSTPKLTNIPTPSPLSIEHFVFDKLYFERKGFQCDSEDSPANVSVRVSKIADSQYVVTLTVSVEKPEEYEAEVSISGFCNIQEETPQKDIMLQVNAPAILFPYARAQLTLLTAQPETTPIVLPVVNFQQMYKESKEGKGPSVAKKK